MTRSIQELRTEYGRLGFGAPMTASEALDLARDLMTHPGYLDGKHPEHGRIVEDVKFFYDAVIPSEGEE
jgi:hypothetical protein